MSYKIEPCSIKEFVTDSNLRLPRFQRKATWDEKQNFELCISIFQDYPVGVVIVNKEPTSSWLLDGRQRRTALNNMRSNPVALYFWAKKYIGFGPREDSSELIKLYWDKVDKYLQKEETEDHDDEDSTTNQEVNDDGGEGANSFNSRKQKRGLTILLNLILMVHQVKSGVSRWERLFDFHEYCNILKYALKRDNYKIRPDKLRDFLLELDKTLPGENLNKDSFCDYYIDNVGVLDDKEKAFKDRVEQNWDDISFSIKTIRDSEKVIYDAKIGIIELTNVSPLDAQNIFSRINSGGTQLKAEELLSAKPFWNEVVNSHDNVLIEKVHSLYTKLEVDIPTDIVRWDLGATLIHRINDQGLLFDHTTEQGNDVDLTNVTHGFKLISSFFLGGMSAKVVNDLEKSREIDWNYGIDNLLSDINKVCEILNNDLLFRFLASWKKPIVKMMGSAVVLEFITILLKDWEEKGRPTVHSNALMTFKRDARILFDKLVFEYVTGVWRGSGDSRMAKHIQNWRDRLSPISEDQWVALINGANVGSYNGQAIDRTHLEPILYYYYILSDCAPNPLSQETFDVDHIVPQSKFINNTMINPALKDCLFNLALLPKKDNIAKKDKALNEITDSWLKTCIKTYEGIDKEDYDKYSDITHIGDLQNARGEMFLKAFKECRNTKLTN